MKTIAVGLAADYASGASFLAYALRIERTDGTVYRFTSYDQDVTISGQTYGASQGMDVQAIITAAGFAVDQFELSTIDDGSVFTRADVLAGRWKNAAFVISRFNPKDPTRGVEVLSTGTLGESTLRQSTLVLEMRGIQQYFQQPIGNVSVKTCRAHFADFPLPNGNNLCRLVAATYTTAGTVTAVASNQAFTAAALAGAADYYTEGILTWTAGDNIGLSQKVKTHAVGGVLGLSLPMIHAVQIGDTFSIIAGCRKRMQEDCSAKFSNQLNFQGEPHRPTTDDLTKAPETSV
jgi:uncharacterized phage protein (TIGR02218 family)